MRAVLIALSMACLLPAFATAGMAEHVDRKKIGGIDVIGYHTTVKDVVTILGALPAGDAIALANQDNAAVARLMAMMLDRGTTREDKFTLAKRLESVGATVYFGIQDQALQITARCLRKDLPLVLDLIAEQLRSPAFLPAEFDKARQQYIGQLQNAKDDVRLRSAEAFRRAIFPVGHPNYKPSIEEYLSAAQTLSVEEVKAFHHKYYGPAHMTLVLVGDVDFKAVQETVAKAFQGWSGGVDYLRETPSASQSEPKERHFTVEVPGKTSTVLAIGQATGLRVKDAQALPLELATAVLGSGFTGRLMHQVRDKEGLTYGISAQITDNVFSDGGWQITGTFAPQLLDRGTTSAEQVLQQWWREGVSSQELSVRKNSLVGTYRVSLANTTGLAHALLTAVLTGRDVSWLEGYPKAVEALTVEQVNTAIKQHLNPESMVIVQTGTLTK